MMKLRKIGAIILAVMMMAVVAAAYAVDDTYEGSNDYGWGVTDSTKVPLTKSIVIFNPDGTSVREPDVSFSYAVTPYDANEADGASLYPATVTDNGHSNNNNPVTVTVLNGVTGSVSGTTITFAQTKNNEEAAYATASAKGTELERTSNLSVDLTKFTKAGIYRYKITETVTPTDVTTVGLEARTNAYSAERYLDLYIGNKSDGTAGFELKGAIIFKTDAVDDSSTPVLATTAINTTTDKTLGFEPSATADSSTGTIDYTNDNTVDRYFTYNIEVNKTITGTMADKTNPFPFVVTMTGALQHAITVDIANTGSGTVAATGSISTTALVLEPALADGKKLTVTGIPKGTTVTVKETNNTYDVYTAAWDTMSGTTTTDAAVKGYDASNTEKTNLALAGNEYAINTAAVAVNGGQTVTSGTIGGEYVKTVLGYTNTLAEISPTGYVARFAPYALILIGGIALLVVAKKHKKHPDEE